MLARHLLPNPAAMSHLFSLNGDDGGGGAGGGGGDGGEQGGGGGGDDGKGKGNADEAKFTQADLDRAASARAAEAKRRAATDLAESLGVTVDEAKRIIAEHQSTNDAKKDEATKAREAADRERAEAEKREAEAARAIREAKVTTHLVRAKVKDDALDDAQRLVDVAYEATDDEIKAAVEALVARRPEIFGTATEDDGADPPAGGGAGGPGGDPKARGGNRGKANESAYERGLKRAKSGGADSDTYAILGQP